MPPIPEHAPAISRLLVDDLGYLWALVHGGPDEMEWDVFDDHGRFLGTVTTPEMRVMHIGERSIARSEEHTSELQSRENLVCRLLLEKKKDRYKSVQHAVK